MQRRERSRFRTMFGGIGQTTSDQNPQNQNPKTTRQHLGFPAAQGEMSHVPRLRCGGPNSARSETRRDTGSASGFTLLELMAIIVIIGLLMAIAAPGWVAFHNTRRLNAAQDEIYQALRQTQVEAKRHRRRWQLSLQMVDGRSQWASHATTTPPMDATWMDLPQGVAIDFEGTTIRCIDNQICKVQFNERGHVSGQLGRIKMMVRESSPLRRSVVVSTLLGALRKAND